MFLEELSTDEPFPLKLVLDRGLTVVVGLGPKRRAWLAGAIADAMAGRGTPLWGVAQVVNMRVDLDDPLVVRSTVGVDPVIGPEIWRSGGGGAGRWTDDLWPSSSLPGHDGAGPAAPSPPGAGDPPGPGGAGSPIVPAPAGPAVAEAGPGRKRRWWRHPADPPPAPAPVAPGPPPRFAEPQPVPVDERPDVPPPVIVAEPPAPAILSEAGPPVPQPLRLPPRPMVSLSPEQLGEPPLPPARPAALDAPAPADPGPHPGPLALPPAPAPPPAPQALDPRHERRVAEADHEMADRQARVVACRAASAAIVVPEAPDTAPVAAARAELERRLDEEAAVVAEATGLAGRWAEAQAAVGRATCWLAPAWLVDATRRQRDLTARQLAEAEAAAASAAGAPLDADLVGQLEAAHAEVLRLEGQGAPRRLVLVAREEEARLLGPLGLPDHAALAARLERGRRRPAEDRPLAAARAAAAEADARWAELQAPRDDAASAAAAADLASVWAEVAAVLGTAPKDVLAALADRSRRGSAVLTAGNALAAAMRAVGLEPPGELDALPATARAWLDGAGERRAAVDAALAAGRRAAEELQRAEDSLAVAKDHHAEAVASLGAATAAAAARRAAAELASQQASARWRQEVEAAQAAHARELERWSAAVAELDRWAAARHEAEAAYERLVARYQQAVAAQEQAQREALAAARLEADEAWEVAVTALEAEFDRCHATRAAWERQRAAAEAEWQAEVAAATAHRRRLEEERAAALTALAAWEERHAPAPSLPELEAMLRRRVAANHTAGPAAAVPLVIDDALASLPLEDGPALFGMVVAAAATTQVIYLTDDPDIVTLARHLGIRTIADVGVPAA